MAEKKKRSPLGVLFLTLFLDLVGFSIIFPLFPDMLRYYFGHEGGEGWMGQLLRWLGSLSADETKRDLYTAVFFGGLLGSLYSLLQFLFAPLWGGLSDRIGRKPVLLISVTGTALGYLVWFFSGSFLLLVLSRLLTGCMSGNIATASAAVADFTAAKDRAKGMGLIGAAFGLGFILGPAIGSQASKLNLVEMLPDGAAALGVNPFSTPALVALLLAVANVLWIVLRFEETLAPELRGASSSRRPINPVALFRSIGIAGVTRANLSYFFYIAAFSGIEFTLTFFATERFEYTHANLWVIFVYVGFIIALVQGGVVRKVAPRFGEQRVAAFGLGLLIPAFFIICFSPSKTVLFIGLGLMAVGSALATPCLTALVSLYAPEDRQGIVLGVFRSLGALARAIGPVTFGAVYCFFGQVTAYAAGGLLLVLPLMVAASLPAADKREVAELPAEPEPAE